MIQRMKTPKASLHVFAIHVYPPFDQTAVVKNRNVVILKLGEVTLKRITDGDQVTLYHCR